MAIQDLSISEVQEVSGGDDSFALLQLSTAGWQSVVNGQLFAYASGVLGDMYAAQRILNSVDTSQLTGTSYTWTPAPAAPAPAPVAAAPVDNSWMATFDCSFGY